MFQIRVHGRAGQGVVTAAEMLSIAAFLEGKHAQAFPSFGSERMGAPVVAFCRIDDKEIRIREPINNPDALIIQDKSVIVPADAFSGLDDKGFALINSATDLQYNIGHAKIAYIGATELAMKHIGRPIPNAVLLGSFVALTGVLSLDSVIEAIKTKFKGSVMEKNIEAATVAYNQIKGED